ncbi:MAG: exosortase-associated EpsI family protein [Kiritimatiellae bacterium]|nr:exosortase-associated EpsI family protein [Kiritimatiellia bacterium]
MKGRWRRLIRFAPLALVFALLAIKAPYIRRAWATSPVDRANMGQYGVLALISLIVAGVALCRRARIRALPSGGIFAFVLVTACAAACAAGFAMDINGIQLVASVGLLWSAAWLAWGRAALLFFAPAALMAALAVPGALHWLENASAICHAAPHAAFAPVFTRDSQPGMLGRELPPSTGLARLFKTGEAHQFMYADESNSVAVLCVDIGDDIHEIHPATHCLRSSGWRIESEEIVEAGLPGGGAFEVDEALASSMQGRMLVWIWYSSESASTGSFPHFRRMHSPSVRWRTYQIATSVMGGDEDVAAARRRLQDFINSHGGR